MIIPTHLPRAAASSTAYDENLMGGAIMRRERGRCDEQCDGVDNATRWTMRRGHGACDEDMEATMRTATTEEKGSEHVQ